ncbi:MAG: hypothetical protein ACJA1A_000101 [Saprospiraceae bacterium]|jgi:hypothetical protein
MKQLFLIFIISVTCVSISYAQLGGMRAYVGITTMTNQDSKVNPEGQTYSGYHIGADGRLLSGTMSFLVGGRYTAVSRFPQENIKIFGHNSKISILNGRVGLGYNIISFGELFKIRTKALASFDIVVGTSGQPINISGYKLNDGWLGGVTGLGFDLGPIILDIEYEFGVLNAYNKKPNSKFNSLTISTGFFF